MSRYNLIATRLDQALCEDSTNMLLQQAVGVYAVPHRHSVDVLLVDNPKAPSKFEVIRVDTVAVGVDLHNRLILQRAVEGTERDWPAGTFVTLALSDFNFHEVKGA